MRANIINLVPVITTRVMVGEKKETSHKSSYGYWRETNELGSIYTYMGSPCNFALIKHHP